MIGPVAAVRASEPRQRSALATRGSKGVSRGPRGMGRSGER
jgi:hypothetical protein